MEALAARAGVSFAGLPLLEQEALWQQVKRAERQSGAPRGSAQSCE
jgi:hypothetical protein